VSSEEPDGTELGLEPNQHPAVKKFQETMMKDGIPFTAFSVDDLNAEYRRLTELEVEFTQTPMVAGEVKIATLNDSCGNLIQLIEMA
jgi:predicted enzyme related to lactoylglutathione lyase